MNEDMRVTSICMLCVSPGHSEGAICDNNENTELGFIHNSRSIIKHQTMESTCKLSYICRLALLLKQGFSLAKDKVRLREHLRGLYLYFQNDALLSFKMRCSE